MYYKLNILANERPHIEQWSCKIILSSDITILDGQNTLDDVHKTIEMHSPDFTLLNDA